MMRASFNDSPEKPMSNPIYPRGFVTPNGRPVSIRTMAHALRAIRANPAADYPGWEWYEVQGYAILRAFRDGLDDRINRRGEAARDPLKFAREYMRRGGRGNP